MQLYYFNVPYRGECIRMLLRHAGVTFTDHRIERPDWPKIKDTFELGQMPVLVYYGQKLAQSYAILQFLGRRYGYMPSSAEEHYETICIMNTFEDFINKVAAIHAPSSVLDPEAKVAAQEELEKKQIPVLLPYIEKKLQAKDNKDFLVGNHLSIADFYILGFCVQLRSAPPTKALWDKTTACPLLKAMVDKHLADMTAVKPPQPKVHYFDSQGRGEMIRLLLRQAKMPFDDVRIKMAEWAGKKDTFPLKQVPVFECSGKQMSQSDAIMHSLSLKFGYLPLEPVKYGKTIELSMIIKDIYEEFVRVFYSKLPEPVKQKLLGDYYTKRLPLQLAAIEKRLKANKCQDFLIGRKYSMADFYLIGAAKWLILNPTSAKDYEPALNAAPTVKQYLTKRLADFP